MTPQLLFVIGASGVGKTAATRLLESRGHADVTCHYFDSITIPSAEVMERDFGGGERWQETATSDWVERLVALDQGAVALLEGQTRPSFIRAALDRFAVPRSRLILLDCDASTRSQRLRGPRGQPELDSPRMGQWAAYLRGQADALGLPVIDTSGLALGDVADRIYQHVQTVIRETRYTERGSSSIAGGSS